MQRRCQGTRRNSRQAPYPVRLALAPRLPAVAKPKVGVAVEPAGKTQFVAKGTTLGGVAVAPVFPVARGLA